MSQIPTAGDMQQNQLRKMAMLLITPQKCFRIPVPTSALKDWIQKHWVRPALHWSLSAAHHCAREEEFINWGLPHKGCPNRFPIAQNGRKEVVLLSPYLLRAGNGSHEGKKTGGSCGPVPTVPQWYLKTSAPNVIGLATASQELCLCKGCPKIYSKCQVSEALAQLGLPHSFTPL